MKKLMGFKSVLFAAVAATGFAASAALPEGYIEANYLNFNGPAFNITLPASAKTTYGHSGLSIKVNVERRNHSSGPHVINAGALWVVIRDSGLFFGNSLKISDPAKPGYTDEEKVGLGIDFEINLNVADDSVNTSNGDAFTLSASPANLPFTDKLYIGGYTGGDTAYDFIGKLYYVRLYDSGTLKMSLVPCVRVNDAKAGLYDVVGNAFYEQNVGKNPVTSDVILDTLTVEASPFEDAASEVNPSYGRYIGEAAQIKTLTAPEVWTNELENERAELIGWQLSRQTEAGWVTDPIVESPTAELADADRHGTRRFFWMWRHFYRIDATAKDPRIKLTPEVLWLENSKKGTITATLPFNTRNILWSGEGVTPANCIGMSLNLTGSKPGEVSAKLIDSGATRADDLPAPDAWTEIGRWTAGPMSDYVANGALTNLVLTGCSGGSAITLDKNMTVCFPRIVDGDILRVQFQYKDSSNLKCVFADFRVDDRKLYVRRPFYGRYVSTSGGAGSVDFENNPSTTQYSSYNVRKIVIWSPYKQRGLVILLK